MSYEVYADIFDRLWLEGRFEEALEAYYYVGRIFERASYVARYLEKKGLLDQAMIEHEFFIESCLQISDRFLPYPSGPVELYLLGVWLENTRPRKSEKYLNLYLQADQFELTMGEGIAYKTETEQILLRIQKAR